MPVFASILVHRILSSGVSAGVPFRFVFIFVVLHSVDPRYSSCPSILTPFEHKDGYELDNGVGLITRVILRDCRFVTCTTSFQIIYWRVIIFNWNILVT